MQFIKQAGDSLRLSNTLIKWYGEHKRELPWRHTSDPYLIWLSEVILQQTRVNQGYSYFVRFTQRFPDVKALAAATEEEILKLWQGLGYYSRARNLHAAAKTVVEKYGAEFPVAYADVLNLKGIGEYTAAAIVSFAYNQPYPVVDGNVFRVLARIFGIDTPIDSGQGKKVFYNLAENLIDRQQPAIYNQAIMEFGALQCVPVSPDCAVCPAACFCMAYLGNKVAALPVKQGKQKTRNRYFHYFDIRHGEYTYLHKREANDIWKNLYEYPLIETDGDMPFDTLRQNPSFTALFAGAGRMNIKSGITIKHVLSHQIIYASFYTVDVEHGLSGNYLEIKTDDIGNYPVSRLIDKYLSEAYADS